MEAPLINFKSMQDAQKQMLDARVSRISSYKPSLCKQTIAYPESVCHYGEESVARLRRHDEDVDSSAMVMWDMPCIFSHIPDSAQYFKPSDLLDLTEHDCKTTRKYTLCHLLYLVAEVSPAFGNISGKCAYDSAIRVCGDRCCCNPFHRAIPTTYTERVDFLSRLNMHAIAFKAHHAKDIKSCIDAETTRRVVSLYLGPLPGCIQNYLSQHEHSQEYTDKRVYIVSYRCIECPDGNSKLALECSSESGMFESHIELTNVVMQSFQSDRVDIPRSIIANGGVTAILESIEWGGSDRRGY